MDWLSWLTPLLLALLAYPLLITGCALDQTGRLETSERLLFLRFPDLPALGAVPVTHVDVTFKVEDTSGPLTLPPVPASVSAGQIGPISVDVAKNAPATFRCEVTLRRESWTTLPPIGPVSSPPFQTESDVVVFVLSYLTWPGAPEETDYDPKKFTVGAELGTA